MALTIPTRIKVMVSRMTRLYPVGFEITDGRGNVIMYKNNNITFNPSDNKNIDCKKSDNKSSTYDHVPGRIKGNYSVSHEAIFDLKGDDADIIINPSGYDHQVPITGVATNHSHNLT